ncbi:hypothetical protein ABT56_09815 [Photobacterium aquae]|uniref:Transport permease protein n=1 Tax=Photobacterium aquae TaxID=1195763 RepID=A0A0J1H213_9GAMM|nr:ABC transporter permease [Photobacterium aquae]KLV05828.1 hypothetical protein ABT56_09815 [Photobacterium aquae]
MLTNYNFLSPLLQHKGLIWTMAKRDLAMRYKGSVMGMLWTFFNPLLMLAIYTFVFQYVFRSKWGMEGEMKTGFAIILFSGLILHMWLTEVFSRSVSLMSSNANFVKKIVFPLEVFPWVVLLSASFQFAIASLVLVGFMVVEGASFTMSMLLAPITVAPLALLLLGSSYLFSALGVFVKDLEQFIGSFVTILLFTSTVFFSLDNVPAIIQPFIKLNPLTIPVEAFRGAVIWGHVDNWFEVGIYTVVSILFTLVSYAFFKKVKTIFPDVM